MGKIVFYTLVGLFSIFCIEVSSFSRVGQCTRNQLNSVKIENVTQTIQANYNGDTAAIELFVNFTWDVFSLPGQMLDGFVFHMLRNDYSFNVNSLVPINICNAGLNYWSNIDNSNCTLNTSICDNSNMDIPPALRLCPSSFLSGEENCRGTGNFYLRSLKYLSVPLNVRNLLFKIDFHSSYELTIYPYYREYVARGRIIDSSNSFPVQPVSNCPETLSKSSGLSLRDSTHFCCEQGIPHFIPRNISVGQPAIYNANVGTINMTLSWLPPIDAIELEKFTFIVYSSQGVFPSPRFDATNITQISLSEDEKKSLSNCDNTSSSYKASIRNLRPMKRYEVVIVAVYKSNSDPHDPFMVSESRPGCFDNRCDITVSIQTPAVNACDKALSICDDNAICTPFDETGVTSLKVSCLCPDGYVGNGLNTIKNILGSGCTDKSYCTPELNPCNRHATCIDKPAPEIGAECVCSDNYFGNGMTCTSTFAVVLGVCIPVLFLLMLFFAILACRYRRLSDKLKQRQSSTVNYQKEVNGSPDKIKNDKYLPMNSTP